MAFSNPNVEIVIDGNGVDDRFGINFHYIESLPVVIVAELWDYTDPNLPQQLTFNLGPDWNIDDSGYPNTEVVTTVPVPLDHKIIIYRNHAAIQGSSFSEGAFPAQSIEDTFDINMLVSQELKAALGRAILNYRGGPVITVDDLAQALVDIADHEIRITDNEGNIATNTAQIGANAIAIGANASAISTNAGQIATNTGQIAANTTAIAGLSPFTVISITSTALPYNASNKEIVIIDTSDDVTVELPAPTAGYQITVKVNNNITNKKISSAAGIDGFGAEYVLSSLYESVSLVSDGTKWYII